MTQISRRTFTLTASAAAAGTAFYAPAAFALFTQHNPNSTQRIDNSQFDALLQRYVQPYNDGITRVRYAALKAEGSGTLNSYISMLTSVRVSQLNRNEQFAYWANLYNALTLKVVVDAYPVSSIRSIGGLLAFGPWKKKRITVEGQQLSLDDIEHNIMRANWREPRIHYAVNCASIGCPNLMTQAFTVANLGQMLNRGAMAYINHPRGAQVTGGRLQVSSIYSWFQEDFGGSDAGVISHLRQYAQGNLQTQLAQVNRIANHDYDWSLNDAS